MPEQSTDSWVLEERVFDLSISYHSESTALHTPSNAVRVRAGRYYLEPLADTSAVSSSESTNLR